MEPELEKQVQERFESLPPDVKAAVQSADFTKKLQAIGNGHLLHIDQLTALEEEIMLIMLGFSDPADFSEHVAKSVRVSKDTADAITKEVSEQIFQPIRESLQEVYKTTTPETPAPPEAPEKDMSPSLGKGAAPMQIPEPPKPALSPAPLAPTAVQTQPSQPSPAPQLSEAPVVPAAPPTPEAPEVPEAHAFPAADAALSQKTVVAPPQKSYSVDPYREPIE